ncbi:hypothetical protein NDU88_005008 [Pleurodeles waltl]|uniref:Uncharacterized protein n=1 Tax=Pleurodeles waltl TaxID=8319 RepID=A0AAV7T985_PLEWA|nr:hypothetical protein NDU88_005008 [Pleurodeles waltl]
MSSRAGEYGHVDHTMLYYDEDRLEEEDVRDETEEQERQWWAMGAGRGGGHLTVVYLLCCRQHAREKRDSNKWRPYNRGNR